MRILFVGAVEFSLRSLEKLISMNVDIVGVCTKEASSFNSDFADLRPVCELYSIPCSYVEDVNSQQNIKWIQSLCPDIMFCFGWSSLVKKELLSIPPMGVVGFHPAKLPENRGRHPLIWALVLGLNKSASTFFFMREGADDGMILSQTEFPILYEDDARTLYDKVVGIALGQIEQFTPKLQSNDYKKITQNPNLSNLWRRREKKDGLIDFRMNSRAIYNLVRGLTRPYIGAHIEYCGQDISIWKVEEVECVNNNIEPGRVVGLYNNSIVVKTFGGAIKIVEHDFNFLPKMNECL